MVSGELNNLTVEGSDPAGNHMESWWYEFTIMVHLYRVEIDLKDELDQAPIRSSLNITIEGFAGSKVMTANGTVVMLLPLGHHAMLISGEGYQDLRYEFDLNGDLEYELFLERIPEDDPPPNEEFPYLLIIMLAITILLILFFYIVPAKLAARYPSDEE